MGVIDLLLQQNTRRRPMGITLPPYCTYTQSFNFRPVAVPEISFDEKTLLRNHPHCHTTDELQQDVHSGKAQ